MLSHTSPVLCCPNGNLCLGGVLCAVGQFLRSAELFAFLPQLPASWDERARRLLHCAFLDACSGRALLSHLAHVADHGETKAGGQSSIPAGYAGFRLAGDRRAFSAAGGYTSASEFIGAYGYQNRRIAVGMSRRYLLSFDPATGCAHSFFPALAGPARRLLSRAGYACSRYDSMDRCL